MNLVVISGCSGGGKSTLTVELKQRGYAIVQEPGRRIVREQILAKGQAVPWVDMHAFLRQATAMSLDDYAINSRICARWVFFDRSFIDTAIALQELTNEPVVETLSQRYRYHQQVFLAPPWPEIYVQDDERRHGFNSALKEYKRLERIYKSLNYRVSILPKVDVTERADFVLKTLGYR